MEVGVAPGVIGLGIASARVCARECLFTSAHVYAIECACITSVGAGVGEPAKSDSYLMWGCGVAVYSSQISVTYAQTFSFTRMSRTCAVRILTWFRSVAHAHAYTLTHHAPHIIHLHSSGNCVGVGQ